MPADSSTADARSADFEASYSTLRADTFRILVFGVGGLLWAWTATYAFHSDDFWPGWGLSLAMLLATGVCFALKAVSLRIASGLFVGSLLVGATLLLWTQGEQPLAPFLFVPVVLIAGGLHGGPATFVAAALASAALVGLAPADGHDFPTPTLGALALLWLTALVSWATTRSLYTALHWSLVSGDQAIRNLDEARRYQGELAAALRQLEQANYRLERANYALSWARAEADEARRLKAQFAAHVSHELRTPLNLVVGFAELMLGSPRSYGEALLPPAYLADLTALHRSARHLQGLIDDILDLSQIDAGEMPVIKDVAEVGAIVHEAVATVRPLLDRKRLAVRVEVAPDLPLLYLDRLRIRQVLLNLLNNAARFTEAGAVSVRAFRDEQHAVVEVADTGVGIKPGDLGKLFRPFHQLESSPTRGRGGTGLGLAISKHLVELHGGRIWARSEGIAGQGSTFGFALPLQVAEELPQDEHAAAEFERRRNLSTAPPAPTVVVLDDDPAIVRLFQRHLDGYQVVGADTEARAVELARSLRTHAVLGDLPAAEDLSRWHQSVTELATRHSIRVLGCPMPSGRRVARALGLLDYLVKPVTREALLESVEAVAPDARTILVVDDDRQMVQLLCRMLRSSPRQYQLLRAYDGQRGLELTRQGRPDLVLLDLLMPQVDGITVLEQMRRDPELVAVPVIAVSARGVVEAIVPSTARTLCLVGDQALPVSRLLQSVRAILDTLPPLPAGEGWGEGVPSAEVRTSDSAPRGDGAASPASE